MIDKTTSLLYHYRFLTDSRILSPILIISRYNDIKAWLRLQYVIDEYFGSDNDVNGLLEKRIELGE